MGAYTGDEILVKVIKSSTSSGKNREGIVVKILKCDAKRSRAFYFLTVKSAAVSRLYNKFCLKRYKKPNEGKGARRQTRNSSWAAGSTRQVL